MYRTLPSLCKVQRFLKAADLVPAASQADSSSATRDPEKYHLLHNNKQKPQELLKTIRVIRMAIRTTLLQNVYLLQEFEVQHTAEWQIF